MFARVARMQGIHTRVIISKLKSKRLHLLLARFTSQRRSDVAPSPSLSLRFPATCHTLRRTPQKQDQKERIIKNVSTPSYNLSKR